MLNADRVADILGRRQNGRWIRDPKKYLDYLVKAASLLTPNNWVQGVYAQDKKGKRLATARTKRAVKFCQLGALEHVTPDFHEYYLSRLILAEAAGVKPDQLSSINDRGDPKQAYTAVVSAYAVAIAAMTEICG